MTSKDEALFLAQVKDTLDDDALDQSITERLAVARRNALNELEAGETSTGLNWPWFIWAPAGAVVIAFFTIAMTLSSANIPEFPYYESELQAATALELELMEELEFVAWMLAEAANAG